MAYKNHPRPPKEAPVIIDKPSDMDVVCAKDKVYSRHKGNLLFRDRIEATKISYQNAKTKHEKMKITKDFVISMQMKFGSRFLKRHGTGWVEITSLQARDKVSHALRFASRQQPGISEMLRRHDSSQSSADTSSQIKVQE